MTFKQWILKQVDRDDITGDFAKDTDRALHRPDRFPGLVRVKNTYQSWVKAIPFHITNRPVVLEALYNAWQEYEAL
jgi:hypothetical protein